MSNHLLQVVWVFSVKYVKEILPVDTLAPGKMIWKVHHNVYILPDSGQKIYYAQLVILWHIYSPDIGILDKQLGAVQHLAQEIFIDHTGRGHEVF